MGALRRAGVWLGLVEEEDDRRDDGMFDDDFADDDDDFGAPVRPRPLTRSLPRAADRGRDPDRDDVRDRADRDRVDRNNRVGRDHRLGEHDPAGHDHRGAGQSDLGHRDQTHGHLGHGDRDLRSVDRFADRELRSVELDLDRDLRLADRETRGERDPRPADPRSGDQAADEDRASRLVDAVEPGGERGVRPPDSGRAERPNLRPLTRPAPAASPQSAPPPGSVTYPTHDNLALAPQVQLRERAVVNDEKTRRYQITTLHPTTYNEARAIGEHFRDGHPVIMNLTEMDEADAKRLVDFAAGLAFGVRGSMERVTNRVFLLSPPNIQVSAEDKARIAEGGFLDQG